MHITYLTFLVPAAGAVRLRGREEARWGRGGLAAAALAVLGLASCSSSSVPDLQEYEEVAGYRLGEVVLDAVDGNGPVLVLRRPSDLDSKEPTAGRCRGLRMAMSGYAVIEAGPDPLHSGPPYDDFHIMAGEDWADQIEAWSQQYPDAVALVSLLFEFPPLSKSQARNLPPLYGFAAGPSKAWARTMRAGRLEAVIRYRSGAEGALEVPSRSATREETFDLRFELVTPENLSEALARGG